MGKAMKARSKAGDKTGKVGKAGKAGRRKAETPKRRDATTSSQDIAGSEVQQEQVFATAISRPQPAEHGDVPEAARAEAQQEQVFATGISRPQPAEH